MLMEHETGKMKELEEQYQGELKEWKGQLRPRKQVTKDIIYHMGTSNVIAVVSEWSICSILGTSHRLGDVDGPATRMKSVR